MSNVLYMEVTKDKYELPVAVANTMDELGKLRGVRASCICYSMKSAQQRGGRCKYVKVVMEDDVYETDGLEIRSTKERGRSRRDENGIGFKAK